MKHRFSSALFLCLFAISIFFYSLACLAFFLFLTEKKRYIMVRLWHRFIVAAAKYICGIHYRLVGWENYQAVADHAVVLVCNHQSAFDIFMLTAIFPQRLRFIFKRELLFVPFFGWVLAFLNMIAINRSRAYSALQQILRQGKQRLQNGDWVVFFPEGKRCALDESAKFHVGAARLAHKTQTLILPLAHNTGIAWPTSDWKKSPATITISIGPAITPNQKTEREMTQQAQTWIAQERQTFKR